MREGPHARGTRPVWGCLDNDEILTAAYGRVGDPNVQAHLSQCGECRRAVRDLARELGHRGGGGSASGIYQAAPRTRPLVARPGFWLVLLLLLALAGYGIKVFLSGKGAEPIAPASTPVEPVVAPAAPEPATAPVRRKRAVRSRPRAQSQAGGGANNGEILATIRRNQGGVKACYERALKRDPNIASRLDVEVRVEATGAVERVSLGGPVDGTELGGCIRNNIKTWQFPAAREAYGTQFPLILVQRGS